MVHTTLDDLSGLIAAPFTPMADNGELALSRTPELVEHLIGEGISGLFVCGGTGEGVSLTQQERKATAEAFVRAAAGRIPVIVHVGQNSLNDARALAAHAAEIGADAISAMPPNYFRPVSIDTLIDSLAVIVEGAPALPFIYYHFPAKSGLAFDLATILQRGVQRLPSLWGVKFTDTRLFDLQTGLEVANGRLRFFFGTDEMLLGGITAGAHGAIGSTYNFAAPLYRRLLAAQAGGDMAAARADQALAVAMVRIFLRYGDLAGQKAIMSLIGCDCGPCRLPNQPLPAAAVARLREDLEASGFFQWARPQ